MEKLEPIARWTDGQDIYRVETVSGDDYYVVDGWDGEKWSDCCKVSDDLNKIVCRDVILSPVYRFQAEDIDLTKVDEGSDDWVHAHELVDFELGRKKFPIQYRYCFDFVIPSLDDDDVLDNSFVCPDVEHAIQCLYKYACRRMKRKPGDIKVEDVEILCMSISETYDEDNRCIGRDRVILPDDYPIM